MKELRSYHVNSLVCRSIYRRVDITERWIGTNPPMVSCSKPQMLCRRRFVVVCLNFVCCDTSLSLLLPHLSHFLHNSRPLTTCVVDYSTCTIEYPLHLLLWFDRRGQCLRSPITCLKLRVRALKLKLPVVVDTLHKIQHGT
jgi:hypothetical protein